MSLIAPRFRAFVGVGLIAAIAHYGLYGALKLGLGWDAVPGTLAGYVAGGVASYALNRAHVFASRRAHREATWRFAVVAGVGFLITWTATWLLVDRAGLHWLTAQIVTTGVVLFWSYSAHRLWTFAGEDIPVPP